MNNTAFNWWTAESWLSWGQCCSKFTLNKYYFLYRYRLDSKHQALYVSICTKKHCLISWRWWILLFNCEDKYMDMCYQNLFTWRLFVLYFKQFKKKKKKDGKGLKYWELCGLHPEVQITLALESFPDRTLNSMRGFLFDDIGLVMLSSVTRELTRRWTGFY